jgi:hypothetical protein
MGGLSLHDSPLTPLPSLRKEARCSEEAKEEKEEKEEEGGASSRVSLPPLPEEAMLLCGERGAWWRRWRWRWWWRRWWWSSRAGPRVARRSSWDSQMGPRDWLPGPLMGGVREIERFKGECSWPPPLPAVNTARQAGEGPTG